MARSRGSVLRHPQLNGNHPRGVCWTTTTTCEALWMGVPVLTLVGERPAARVGASLLTRVGLESLIAHWRERFVAVGATLAGDVDALVRLRTGLRERMSASPLGNASLWVPHTEGAYREHWTRWCLSHDQSGF